jgi:hypothetical protein
LIPGQSVSSAQKPRAEVIVEGELSPFEHEALYRILRKSFTIDHPSYTELLDEDAATRVNVIFHHPYANTLFTEVLQENWRDLKELFKQVSHRRGRAGAAFNLKFMTSENQLIFKSGVLNEREVASALDQIGHLTGVFGQMLRQENMQEPVERIEAVFDKKSDRWHDFRGSGSGRSFVFDDSMFRWVPVPK